jgi:regulatory protein
MTNERLLLSKTQVLAKAENYCAYQERSIYEVRSKLKQWNFSQQEIESTISHLIQENFLNETRFAEAYTLGKFRINGWGKLKIKYALKLKKIAPELITKSLQKIDDSDYICKLKQLIEKKSQLLTEKDPYKRRYQLSHYASTKGFELELISDLLNKKQS